MNYCDGVGDLMKSCGGIGDLKNCCDCVGDTVNRCVGDPASSNTTAYREFGLLAPGPKIKKKSGVQSSTPKIELVALFAAILSKAGVPT